MDLVLRTQRLQPTVTKIPVRNRPNRDFFICLPVSSISLIVWWCCKKNSNLQPIAYKAIALPIELLQQILAPILGIEPRTYGLTFLDV